MTKISYKDRMNLYFERKNGMPFTFLKSKYNINKPGLAKSVYDYTLSKTDKYIKTKEIMYKIKEEFINNKEKYSYRRITLELRNQEYNVNHKKVYRIMIKLELDLYFSFILSL